MTTANAFSTTLDVNSNGWTGYTRRLIVPASALTIPGGTQTQIRLTLRASAAESYSVGALYVGHKASSGNAYNYAATPAQILFSGSGSVTIPAGSTVTSDWINFSWDKTSALVFGEQCGGSSSSDSAKAKNSTAADEYYKAATTEAATVLCSSGYSLSSGLLELIEVIEMDGYVSTEYQPAEPTDGGSRYSISRQVNTAVSLFSSETEVPDFRISVFTNAAATATLDFQTDIVHNDLSGYTGVLACGCVLTMREGTTWAAMKAATPSIIQRGITGGNIYDHTGHYVTLSRRAKVSLEANKYYQFCIDLLSTRPADTTSGQASLLVEGGNGINSFIATIDKNETLAFT